MGSSTDSVDSHSPLMWSGIGLMNNDKESHHYEPDETEVRLPVPCSLPPAAAS